MQRRFITEVDLEKPENSKLKQEANNIDFSGEVSIDTIQVERINFSYCTFEKLIINGGNVIPISLTNCSCKEIFINGKVGTIIFNSLKECQKLEFKSIHTEKVIIRNSEINRLAYSFDGTGGYIKESEVSDCIILKEFIANVKIDLLTIRGKNNIYSFCTGDEVKKCSVFEGGDILSTFRGVSLDIGKDCSVFFSKLHIDNFVCRFKDDPSTLEVHDSTINKIHFWPNKTDKSGRIQIDNCQIIDSFSVSDGAIKRIYLSHLSLSSTHIEFLNHIENEDFIWDNVIWPTELKYYYSRFQYHDGKKTIRNLKQKAISIGDKFSISLFNSLELRHKFESLRRRKLCKKYKVLDKSLPLPYKPIIAVKEFIMWFINPFIDLFRVFFKNCKGFPIQDRLTLYISKYSNNFGQDWFRAILFTTIGSGIIFYFYGLSLTQGPFCFGWNGWPEYLSILKAYIPYYIKFLNPTHSFELIKGYEVNALASIWDFFGRIYVSFGYYQVIRTFRKYF